MFLTELLVCTLLMCTSVQTEVVREQVPIYVGYVVIVDKEILEVQGIVLRATESWVILTDAGKSVGVSPMYLPERLEWGRQTVSKGSHP